MGKLGWGNEKGKEKKRKKRWVARRLSAQTDLENKNLLSIFQTFL
jgi:hypothetical protein